MDCSNCASLCCVAPTILRGSENQGRRVIKLVKEVNQRCNHLAEDGACGIYNERNGDYSICELYTCKGFGPHLTEYLRKNNHILENGRLDQHGMRMFSLLSGMLMLSNRGVKDLEDAVTFYRDNNAWPEWMMTEEYLHYLFGKGIIRINPRNNGKKRIIAAGKKIIQTATGFF